MTYKMKGFSYPGKSPVKYNGGDPIESGYTEQGDSFLEAVDEDLEAVDKDLEGDNYGDDQVLKASINAGAKIATALVNKGGKKKKEKKNLTDAFATMNLGTNRDA